MDVPFALHLRDLGGPLVAAWRREFAGVEGVTISEGDIFSNRPGAVGPDDPIDIKADAIVSARQMRVAWDRVHAEDRAGVPTWRAVLDEEARLMV